MRGPKRIALQRGMLLAEVLVALAVMSVGTVAVLTLLSQSVAMRSAELQRMRLARLAADAGELAAMHPASVAAAPLDTWAAGVSDAMPGVNATVAIGTRGELQVADVHITYRDNRGYRLFLRREYALGAS